MKYKILKIRKHLGIFSLAIMCSLNFSCGPLKFSRVNTKTNPVYNSVGGSIVENNENCYYVFGGKKNGSQTNEILKYHENSNSWELLPNRFPESLSNSTINTSIENTNIFFHLGGEYNGLGTHQIVQTFPKLFKINLGTNPITIDSLKRMPDFGAFKGISRHSSVIIGNKLYVFGGIRSNYPVNSNFQTMNNLDIYKYDIPNNTWETLNVQLHNPVENGFIINKNNYYYIFDGSDNDYDGKFIIQVFKFSNDTFSWIGNLEKDYMIDSFSGLPFIYTRDKNDLNKFYYYPINGDCRIHISDFNNSNPPSSSNDYHFNIDYSDFDFPNELVNSRKGSVVHGNILSSDWLIIGESGTFLAKPK